MYKRSDCDRPADIKHQPLRPRWLVYLPPESNSILSNGYVAVPTRERVFSLIKHHWTRYLNSCRDSNTTHSYVPNPPPATRFMNGWTFLLSPPRIYLRHCSRRVEHTRDIVSGSESAITINTSQPVSRPTCCRSQGESTKSFGLLTPQDVWLLFAPDDKWLNRNIP